MPNFTNLPERHFVDKAKKLSFGDQDKDTYFDGDTLSAMLEAIAELKIKKFYQHNIVFDNKSGCTIITLSSTAFTNSTLSAWLKKKGFITGAEYPCYTISDIPTVSNTTGRITFGDRFGVCSDNGTSLRMHYKNQQCYVDEEGIKLASPVDAYTTISSLVDTVIEIS